MHGSTVTYKVVVDRGYFEISGVRDLSDKMLSIASSSACRVASKFSQVASAHQLGASGIGKRTHVS